MNPTYQLTGYTVDVLKNFCEINPQVILREGASQRNVNVIRNFIADIELDSPLPADCPIGDLGKILSIIDSCKGTTFPSLEFTDRSLKVVHEHGKVTIPSYNPSLIKPVSPNQFHMADTIATFDLTTSLWKTMQRQAGVLECDTLRIILTDNGELTLRLLNDKDPAADSGLGSADFVVPNLQVAADAEPNVWSVRFNTLRLLQGNYKVEVGNIGTNAAAGTIFGAFFTLDDKDRAVKYLTSGAVVKQ